MRRKLSIISVFFLLVSILSACAAASSLPTKNASGKISVVATIFPCYDFARAITGELAELTMLIPPGAESHTFEPSPKDNIKIQNCDVFIYVGGESDTWIKKILSATDTSKIRIITLMDCVQTVEEELSPGMQPDATAADSDSAADSILKPGVTASAGFPAVEYDEHVWTSPKNAKLIVSKIADAICATDPENADIYSQNAAAYQLKLDALDAEFQSIVDGAARHTIIFGDRFPFRYFTDAYNLSYYAAFPGCSTETEASAATVKFLIDIIRAEKIPVVFHIEMSSEKMSEAIAEATGAKVMLLHACHNVSLADFKAGKTYLDFMADDALALRAALY